MAASASDEIIWSIINQQFCSYKLKTDKKQTFCREEHNVTGLCNRQSCPLANSRYATVRRHPTKDTLYLYIKTIERAHTPARLWQKIKLSGNYTQALQQVDDQLIHWPKFLIHKCKQRLTRLVQVNMRMRKLAREEARLGERLVTKQSSKIRKREEARERKAESASRLEQAIERELLERLRTGAYGDQPLNVSETIWKKVLTAMEREGKAEREQDPDEGIEEEDSEEEAEGEVELEDDLEKEVEYVADLEESEDELEDIEDWLGSDDDEQDEDEEEEDIETEEEEAEAKKIGQKRKRSQAVRIAGQRKKQLKTEERETLKSTLDW